MAIWRHETSAKMLVILKKKTFVTCHSLQHTVQYRRAHTQERDWFRPFPQTHVFKGFANGANRKLEILKKYFDSAILKP